ncbi:hypothetical protein LR48_Vigan588s001600 [Vigna angularis]|uniref:Glycosyl transferase family 1 domain-containing protein n=2 Tax=Phaseolus angularis TaxID=3914 RepID=A0A0L9TE45_PHAAN|nr:uncharacterized protein LOC108321965 isoform X1 [Vigna angularis]KAG2401904.1 uncharacterized protein HKW66_Vig0190590 [Vigna angularis]KOM28808.1 hypothetical protein LR48_Vigan588s001600 [Vigna angularis]BAT94599.1 hypothetical protein VIGAN_08121500 [Vigna angularis var. angularis]
MGLSRNAASQPEIDDAGGDIGFHAIRGGFPFKRNPSHYRHRGSFDRQLPRTSNSSSSNSSSRSHLHSRLTRKGLLLWLFPFSKSKSGLYALIIAVVFLFAFASVVMQNSITSVFRQRAERGRYRLEGLRFGTTLRFVPGRVSQGFLSGNGLDRIRSQPRLGVRPPRIALILGHMTIDPQSLMLVTVIRNLQKLGYVFKIFAVGHGKAHSIWESIGGGISRLNIEKQGLIDWSIFEGIIVGSLEAKEAVSSLMQEPFCSIPLIWIIQEDRLSSRLPVYEQMGWEHLVSHWRNAFSRASVVVFPDFTYPMLYSGLDTGNFFVIPGSPVDVWAAERYRETHGKDQLRELSGFDKYDMVVLVVGSSVFYDDLSWDYAVAMHSIGPLLTKYARRNDATESFKFVFLCGNSTDGSDDALQEVASRLGLLQGSVRHYGLNGDVNSVLLMADIILYGSAQEVQGFPPLLIRAMTFEIPVIAPDFPVLKKYIVDGVHGIFFPKQNPEALMTAFSLLISNGRLSKFAKAIASSGRRLAKNVLSLDCITGYARLLENVLSFPSDALLPGPVSEIQQGSWEWNLLQNEINLGINWLKMDGGFLNGKVSVVYDLEHELGGPNYSTSVFENGTEFSEQNELTQLDWDVLREIEISEENEMFETEEVEERMEKDVGVWDNIYRSARKSEKLKFEVNERDVGELERTGQPVCIYEIYNGAGVWPLLHHGSLYRGLSLSRRGQRQSSDDVDAVGRLPLLNDTYYQEILCEMGGMFAIANRVDNIHRRPWIGFQSWRAAGRKVALSMKAEKVLEQRMQENSRGDVIYFWGHLDMDRIIIGNNNAISFWYMCDILNGGNCRTVFQDGFRQMYALPPDVEALPPMPEDGGYWSALHSWVMPTPSFLEFVMFSRMFVDSIDALRRDSSKHGLCLLGSSEIETKHCYCRVLELLINVWAYHSARRMVYINPNTGSTEEQHPIEQRKGFMWVKYFNFSLLKSMDEDLAEAADDGDHPRDMWLWPMTGEVHWHGVFEREREERYRLKMDKKRKTKEKLFERMKYGYKQKSLGR